MSKNIGPYSNHTLHAFIQYGRATRAIARAVERLDCPASISRRLRELDKPRNKLQHELVADYFSSSNNRFVRLFTGRAFGLGYSILIILGAAFIGYAVAL